MYRQEASVTSQRGCHSGLAMAIRNVSRICSADIRGGKSTHRIVDALAYAVDQGGDEYACEGRQVVIDQLATQRVRWLLRGGIEPPTRRFSGDRGDHPAQSASELCGRSVAAANFSAEMRTLHTDNLACATVALPCLCERRHSSGDYPHQLTRPVCREMSPRHAVETWLDMCSALRGIRRRPSRKSAANPAAPSMLST